MQPQATADERKKKPWVWPTAIILGLTVVVCVNVAFIYIAVSGQDEVLPSYATEER